MELPTTNRGKVNKNKHFERKLLWKKKIHYYSISLAMSNLLFRNWQSEFRNIKQDAYSDGMQSCLGRHHKMLDYWLSLRNKKKINKKVSFFF